MQFSTTSWCQGRVIDLLKRSGLRENMLAAWICFEHPVSGAKVVSRQMVWEFVNCDDTLWAIRDWI